MNSAAGTILTRLDGHVLTVTISNLRRHNAVSLDMFHQLKSAVEAAEVEGEVRAIVLRGDGTAAFSTGADLSFAEGVSPQIWAEVEAAVADTLDAIHDLSIPVIALVSGYCFGGGVALALTADLRVATTDAVFAIPAARLGVGYPSRQVAQLVEVVGPAYAAEILYTARRLTAAEALACGLVTRVVDPLDAEPSLDALARSIADNAPRSIRAAKAAIRAAESGADTHLTAAAARAVEACTSSEDFREGTAAFLQRRAPSFTGR
jgi:enoyl-CoA hydratase/carnithine racemase